MKIVMFFASLLSLPICYLLAIIPTSLIMAIWGKNMPWLIWVITAAMYFSLLHYLLSAVDRQKQKNEST